MAIERIVFAMLLSFAIGILGGVGVMSGPTDGTVCGERGGGR